MSLMWGSRGTKSRGLLSRNRLIGMYCWMGSHFHDRVECNGVTNFNRVTRMGSQIVAILGYATRFFYNISFFFICL